MSISCSIVRPLVDGACGAAWTMNQVQTLRPATASRRFISRKYTQHRQSNFSDSGFFRHIPTKSSGRRLERFDRVPPLHTQADLIEWLRDRPDDATARSTFAEEEHMNRFLGLVAVLTVVCLAAPASAQVQ